MKKILLITLLLPLIVHAQEAVKLPAALIGSTTIQFSSEEAMRQAIDYCRGKEVNRQTIFSEDVMLAISSQQYEINSEIGLVCIKKFIEEFNQEAKKEQLDLCGLKEKKDCATSRANSARGITILNGTYSIKEEQVLRHQKIFFNNKFSSLEEEAEIAEAFKAKVSENGFNCWDVTPYFKNNNKVYRTSKMHDLIAQNLDSIMENSNTDCASQFLQNYVVAKDGILKSNQDFKEFCSIHATDYCQSNEKKRAIIIGNIDKMFTKVYGDRGKRILTEILECKIEESQDSLVKIMEKIKGGKKVMDCLELRPGEHKVMSWQQSNDVTKTGDYLLKRKEDEGYEAVLSVGFKPGEGINTSAEDMMKRVKSCMDTISPYLKGANGETLAVRVLDKEEIKMLPANERPSLTEIGIDGPNFRSRSKRYGSDIDCPTIAHEVMHLFGLCDEYKERFHAWADCRVVPKVPSLMKDHEEVFNRAIPKTMICRCDGPPCKTIMEGQDENLKTLFLANNIYNMTDYDFRSQYCNQQALPATTYQKIKFSPEKTVTVVSSEPNKVVVESRFFTRFPKITRSKVTCVCPYEDESCQEAKQAFIEAVNRPSIKEYCPQSAQLIGVESGKKTITGDTSYEDGYLKIFQRPVLKSLIHPNHFERIIGGACPDKGASYSECAQFAYTSGECKVPEKCNDEKFYLGVKEE